MSGKKSCLHVLAVDCLLQIWPACNTAYSSSLWETCPVALSEFFLKMKGKPALLKLTFSKMRDLFDCLVRKLEELMKFMRKAKFRMKML